MEFDQNNSSVTLNASFKTTKNLARVSFFLGLFIVFVEHTLNTDPAKDISVMMKMIDSLWHKPSTHFFHHDMFST